MTFTDKFKIVCGFIKALFTVRTKVARPRVLIMCVVFICYMVLGNKSIGSSINNNLKILVPVLHLPVLHAFII